MKRYNITVPRKYTKDGEEKTVWNTVGTLLRFHATAEKPEAFKIDMPIFGATTFFVFEQKPRGEASTSAATPSEPAPTQDDIAGDIPF